jgi:hypothetical protein
MIPPFLVPSAARHLVTTYVNTYRDPLFITYPLWYQSLVTAELYIQLPFFIAALYAFIKRRNWIRIPAIIVGSMMIESMVPILTTLATHEARGYDRAKVLGFYVPYLVIPMMLVSKMAMSPTPFKALKSGGGKGRGGGRTKRA